MVEISVIPVFVPLMSEFYDIIIIDPYKITINKAEEV